MAETSGWTPLAPAAPAGAVRAWPLPLRAAVATGVLCASAWGACALAFQAPGGPVLRSALAVAWVAAGALALAALRRGAGGRAALAGWLLGLAALGAWWQALAPADTRHWADDVAHLATNVVDGSSVTIDRVRNFEWQRDGGYVPGWEERRYDLDRLASVDLVLSHWSRPSIAHVLVSFGFDDGQQLAISLEIRRERDEPFSRMGGFFKAYETAIVAADERDIVRVRTNLRNEDAYLYRVALSPEQRRALLLAYLGEANRLAAKPRWYHTVTANCTTIVFHMVRQLVPELPLDHRLVLSGYLPDYLYEVGGLDRSLPFAELRERARITERARAAGASADFSQAIRRGIPRLPEPDAP